MAEYKSFGEAILAFRKNLGISLREAARQLNMTPSYISKLELDRCGLPSGDLIRRMATTYRVPVQVLLEYASKRTGDVVSAELDSGTLHKLVKLFRTQPTSDAVTPESLTADELIELIHDLVKKLPPEEQQKLKVKQRLDFSRLATGRRDLFAARVKPRFLSKIMIREMSDKYLASHGLTMETYRPPTPIERLVEYTPYVRFIASDSEDMSCDATGRPIVLGLTKYDDDYKTKLIEINEALYDSNDPRDLHRFNYTLAHELFHAIEHLPLVDKMVGDVGLFRMAAGHVERSLKANWWEKEQKPRKLTSNEDWQEWQAQRFAAEVLMPKWSLEDQFEDFTGSAYLTPEAGQSLSQYANNIAGMPVTYDDTLMPLHEVYAVSRQAMAIRLMDLNLIIA